MGLLFCFGERLPGLAPGEHVETPFCFAKRPQRRGREGEKKTVINACPMWGRVRDLESEKLECFKRVAAFLHVGKVGIPKLSKSRAFQQAGISFSITDANECKQSGTLTSINYNNYCSCIFTWKRSAASAMLLLEAKFPKRLVRSGWFVL